MTLTLSKRAGITNDNPKRLQKLKESLDFLNRIWFHYSLMNNNGRTRWYKVIIMTGMLSNSTRFLVIKVNPTFPRKGQIQPHRFAASMQVRFRKT